MKPIYFAALLTALIPGRGFCVELPYPTETDAHPTDPANRAANPLSGGALTRVPPIQPGNHESSGGDLTASNPKRLDVKNAQRILKEEGYAVTVDGHMNESTRSAIRAFQTTHGLDETGLLDVNTRNTLDRVGNEPKQEKAGEQLPEM
jgi:peptidoglycan hydrolase-like protein with peptidoglycan-binding domain